MQALAHRQTRLALAALALAALIAASVALPADARRAKPKTVTVLKARKIGTRTLLTNARGFTVYYLTGDRKGERCAGNCLGVWPLLRAPSKGRLVGARGVRGKIAVVRRPDGRRQLTFRGHPLYTYFADNRPGQAKGDGVAGVWFALKAG